jgi:hypothetical protein
MPAEKDYVVDVFEWEARRVYNFIRGVASRGMPVTLIIDNRSLQVTGSTSYSHEYAYVTINEETIRVRCKNESQT